MAQTVETVESAPQAPPPGPLRRGQTRQTRVVIRKVGPWSVFKMSLIFYFCIMLVIEGALVILYQIMQAAGVLDNLANLLGQTGFGNDKGQFTINGSWLLARTFVLGVAMVIIWSLINLFLAFMYNLISDVIGGVEVTLGEKR